MLVYFLVLGVLGAIHLVDRPSIFFNMINPLNAISFFLDNFWSACSRSRRAGPPRSACCLAQ
jgi:K+ transporter